MNEAAFYCVSSGLYFVGAVAMINSLRLHGHREPVFLLDCGLSDAQRELLEPQATIVPAPAGEEDRPHMLKAIAPLAAPAAVRVLVDADLIFTRPLTALMRDSGEDGVLAVADGHDRFVAQWGELIGGGQARRGPYVSSGFVVLRGDTGETILRSLDRLRGVVDLDESFLGRNDADYPFRFADQDLLNAILRTSVPAEKLEVLEPRAMLKQPFADVVVADPGTLRCELADGSRPYMLHHILGHKPWMGGGEASVYARFMRRLLTGDGLAVQIPQEWLPRSLRSGRLAALERRLLTIRDEARFRAASLRQRLRGAPGGWA